MLEFLFIGLVAGWLAGKVAKGTGFGLIGNLFWGIVGSYAGGFLFKFLNIAAGGTLGAIAMATVGALAVLFIVGKIKR